MLKNQPPNHHGCCAVQVAKLQPFNDADQEPPTTPAADHRGCHAVQVAEQPFSDADQEPPPPLLARTTILHFLSHPLSAPLISLMTLRVLLRPCHLILLYFQSSLEPTLSAVHLQKTALLLLIRR